MQQLVIVDIQVRAHWTLQTFVRHWRLVLARSRFLHCQHRRISARRAVCASLSFSLSLSLCLSLCLWFSLSLFSSLSLFLSLVLSFFLSFFLSRAHYHALTVSRARPLSLARVRALARMCALSLSTVS